MALLKILMKTSHWFVTVVPKNIWRAYPRPFERCLRLAPPVWQQTHYYHITWRILKSCNMSTGGVPPAVITGVVHLYVQKFFMIHILVWGLMKNSNKILCLSCLCHACIRCYTYSTSWSGYDMEEDAIFWIDHYLGLQQMGIPTHGYTHNFRWAIFTFTSLPADLESRVTGLHDPAFTGKVCYHHYTLNLFKCEYFCARFAVSLPRKVSAPSLDLMRLH